MSGATFGRHADPSMAGIQKEAWACMSHIVLEGRRKTRMDNVITVHAKSVEPLYILIHGLKISYVLKYKEA